MNVEFLGKKLSSPLFIPSGIWPMAGAEDILKQVSLDKIGFVVLKTITLEPREGNSGIRVYDSPCGMLNSIGLANPGLDIFLGAYKEHTPEVNHIISVMPQTLDEFDVFGDRLSSVDLWAVEVNLSCPNVSHGHEGGLISQSPSLCFEFIKKAKMVFSCPVIAKLSPDVTDIVEIAYACKEAGADALALVNTFSGVRIDIEKAMPVFDRIVAGVSGPAIFPLALRRIWQVASSRRIGLPILGMGGVYDSRSVIEMAMAGADVVGIGSAFLRDPVGIDEVAHGIQRFLSEKGLTWKDVVRRAIR